MKLKIIANMGVVGSIGNTALASLSWLQHGYTIYAFIWLFLGACSLAACLSIALERKKDAPIIESN